MFFIVVFLSLLSFTPAYASTSQNGVIPSGFKEGFYSLGAETTYLSTSANYTERGTSLDFDDQYAYSAIQTLVYARYDFSDQLSTFVDLPLNYVMSENPSDEYSAFAVAGLGAGVNYDFKMYSVIIIPQIKGYLAIENFDRSYAEPLTSDGTSYLDVGSHFFKRFSNFQLHGFLSYQYRLEGFSGLLNYQTDLTYKTESSSYTFGLKGFQTVIDDEHSGNPAYRHTYLAVVNGGSLLYGSVDPSRTDLFTQIKLTLNESFDLYGSVNKSIRGENSGDILSFTVGLEYFFSPTREDSLPQDDFKTEDEYIDPKIEQEIKNYNKPKKIPKKINPPRERVKSTITPKKNGLVISKKQLGKKTTSTSPVRAKPKSKKAKRVRVEF